MPYPVFTIESIRARCEKDITDFLAQEQLDRAAIPLQFSLVETMEDPKTQIRPLTDFMQQHLGENTYVTQISNIGDEFIKKQLWIARTYLFYQFMIFVIIALGDPAKYTELFGVPNETTVFAFRQDFASELVFYQLGIFGSKTPTSDIDVGIQYIGTSRVPALAYMVSAFENVFVKLTGKSSLDFDIECYADMYLYPGPNGTDVFYLDTGNFEIGDFEKVLPVVGLSIARNALMEKPDEPLDFTTLVGVVDTAINGKLELNVHDEAIMASLNKPEWLSGSMAEMKAFLQASYDDQRTKYYQAVNAAEALKMEKVTDIETAKRLSKEDVCSLILAIGTALAYRMESYTCAATITHVVRILQGSPENKQKYATKKPEEICKLNQEKVEPYCAIGKFGFILSILEQMGYIYRFYNHYCIGSHPDPSKCEKKMTKYGDRYKDAFVNYNRGLSGGNARRRRVSGRRLTGQRRNVTGGQRRNVTGGQRRNVTGGQRRNVTKRRNQRRTLRRRS
jgi:hypothetical protein